MANFPHERSISAVYRIFAILTWNFVEEPFGCSRVCLNVTAVGGPVEVGYKTGAAPTVADATVVILDGVNINKIVIRANSQVLPIWRIFHLMKNFFPVLNMGHLS